MTTDTTTTGTEPQGPTATTSQGPTRRLKKDGTPDRRGGKVGNKGNRHATGRKKIEGQETRKLISFMATEKEYRLLLTYATILKADAEKGLTLLDKLGTPPDGRAKKDGTRTKRVIRVFEAEKQPIRDMLAIIKDRYDVAYMIISAG